MLSYICFPLLCRVKFCGLLFSTDFFHLRDKKKLLMVALDRWSSYTVTIVWEFARAQSALVVLDKWSSYRGGRLNRFDCRNYRKNLCWLHFNDEPRVQERQQGKDQHSWISLFVTYLAFPSSNQEH